MSTAQSMVCKINQAKKWLNKLRTQADKELQDRNDVKSYEIYEKRAIRLQEAIMRIEKSRGNKLDWLIFNKAVSQNTRLDIERRTTAEYC